MKNTIPKIYFYIRRKASSECSWPKNINDYWSWMQGVKVRYPGAESWILQTYLQLKAINFPCQITDTLPDEGIIIAHPFSLPFNLKPGPKVLLICTRDDKQLHPYCQIHIVQNRKQASYKLFSLLWQSYYIPLWPQIGLIPRNDERGDLFKNVAYFGDLGTLAPELRGSDWAKKIEELGCHWMPVSDTTLWNDYSQVDAVVAIRSFDNCFYANKPASKLYNAWRAGVPAILGRESAYQAERKNELDYLEANSVDAVLSGIMKLRNDIAFRKAVVSNGKLRAQEVETVVVVDRWRNFLLNKAIPLYNNWCSTPTYLQDAFLRSRHYVYLKIDPGVNFSLMRSGR